MTPIKPGLGQGINTINRIALRGVTLDELNDRVLDAVNANIELYEDMGRDLPGSLNMGGGAAQVWFESLVVAEG